MIGPFDIEPRRGGAISAYDLAELQRLAYVFSNLTCSPPLVAHHGPGGISLRLDTDLSGLGVISGATITNVTFTGGTSTSTSQTWTITGDTWTWDVTSTVYLPGSGTTYVGTVPLKPCTLNWCPVLVYTDESISPAYTRTGNILTAISNGAIPNIDGVAPVLNDRILVNDGFDGTNTGIYYVSSAGSGGTPYTLTRDVDANASAMFWPGRMVVVTKGTDQGDTLWELATDGAITLNTTSLAFVNIGRATHRLLSATHSDTVASTPVRGGMIRANSTPAYEQRAIGAAGYVWTSDGTDCDWQSALKPISVTLGGTITGGTTWYKATVPYTNAAFIVASTTATVTLFTLPAGAVPKAFKVKHSVAWAGTGVGTLTLTTLACATPTLTLFSGSINLMAAVAKTTGLFATVTGGSSIPSHSDATTTVTATFACNTNFGDGATTVLTAGSVDIWLEVDVVT